MAKYRVKPQFEREVVGFNKSSAPLGERNDLEKLFEIATNSRNQSLLDMIEEIPDGVPVEVSELKKSKIKTDAAKTE